MDSLVWRNQKAKGKKVSGRQFLVVSPSSPQEAETCFHATMTSRLLIKALLQNLGESC